MRWIRATQALLLVALMAPAPARADRKLDDAIASMRKTELVFGDLAKRVMPAVVTITRFVDDQPWWKAANEGKTLTGGWQTFSWDDLLYEGKRPTGGGSGFLISDDGYILTLRRVVVELTTGEPPDTIDVQMGNDRYGATVVGMEPSIDLAILKIVPRDPTPFLKLGDSGKTHAGHYVVAFGDPAGNEKVMVPGIVSYEASRQCYQDELSATYLQTSMRVSDAALGGPLVNLSGEVIGINTRRSDSAKPESTGVEAGSGYVLPINLATAIYNSLIQRTDQRSPWLGISVRTLSDDLRKETGVGNAVGIYIDNVFVPSPATQVGIQMGDVLTFMDKQPITDVYEFQRKLYELGVGTSVKLTLLRAKKRIELTAEIAPRPAEATTR